MSKSKLYTAKEIKDLIIKDNLDDVAIKEKHLLLDKLIQSKELNLISNILEKTEEKYEKLYKKLDDNTPHSNEKWKKLLATQKALFRAFEIYNDSAEGEDLTLLYKKMVQDFAKSFPLLFVNLLDFTIEEIYEQTHPNDKLKEYAFDELAKLISANGDTLNKEEKKSKEKYLKEFVQWPEFVNDILGKTLDYYFTKYKYKLTPENNKQEIWSTLSVSEQHLFRKLELYNQYKVKTESQKGKGLEYFFNEYTKICERLDKLGKLDSLFIPNEHLFRELNQYDDINIKEDDEDLEENKELLQILIQNFTQAYPNEFEETLNYFETQSSIEQELELTGVESSYNC